MSNYLSTIQSSYPNIFEARERFHEEFKTSAKIPGIVSIIFFPLQGSGQGLHSKFEIEGTCYSFSCLGGGCPPPPPSSYDCRIWRIRRGPFSEVQPSFVRISLNITPNQIWKIQKEIELIQRTSGLTCMHGVAKVAKQYAGCSIPFPISLFPTASAEYLFVSKKVFASHKIHKIDTHFSHRSRAMQVSDVVLGTVLELFVMITILNIIYRKILP